MKDNSHAKNFSQFPLAWLAVCFAAGIFVGKFVAVSAYFLFIVILTLGAFACVLLIRKKHSKATMMLFAAFVLSGAALFQIEKQSVEPSRISRIYDGGQINFKTPVELTGMLQQEPEQTPDGYFLTLETEKIFFNQTEQTASGAVRLFLPVRDAFQKQDYDNLNLHFGMQIRVLTQLTREDRYRNPGGLNYREVLAQKNLDASGTIFFPPGSW